MPSDVTRPSLSPSHHMEDEHDEIEGRWTEAIVSRYLRQHRNRSSVFSWGHLGVSASEDRTTTCGWPKPKKQGGPPAPPSPRQEQCPS